jgi:S-DNA-T family DNA segregation ATPase FtsK/SpoIIIE
LIIIFIRHFQFSIINKKVASELKQNSTSETGHSLANEIFAVVWLAVAVLLALCLFTFHPNDQSFNTASQQTTQNFVGTIGANVATVLLQSIGLTAYLLPILCLILAWRSFKGEGFSTSASRVAGFVLLVLSAAALFVTFGFNDFFDGSVPAGGLTGTIFARLLIAGLGSIGASILLVAVALVACLHRVFNFLPQPLSRIV